MAIERLVNYVGDGLELGGVVVIVAGVAGSLASYLFRWATRREADQLYHRARQAIGRSILLGLELLVAGDIIRTVALSPLFPRSVSWPASSRPGHSCLSPWSWRSRVDGRGKGTDRPASRLLWISIHMGMFVRGPTRVRGRHAATMVHPGRRPRVGRPHPPPRLWRLLWRHPKAAFTWPHIAEKPSQERISETPRTTWGRCVPTYPTDAVDRRLRARFGGMRPAPDPHPVHRYEIPADSQGGTLKARPERRHSA